MGSCPQTNFRLSNFLETKGTRVRSPARLPACLRGLRAHCATVRRASREEGSGERPPQRCPESPVPALRVSSGNTLLTYHPGIHLQIHTPLPQRDEETNRQELQSFVSE